MFLLHELYLCIFSPPIPNYDGLRQPTVKRREVEKKEKKDAEENIVLILQKNSQFQGCELLTDLNFSVYLSKLGHLKPLATLGFIFELFDSFKLLV